MEVFDITEQKGLASFLLAHYRAHYEISCSFAALPSDLSPPSLLRELAADIQSLGKQPLHYNRSSAATTAAPLGLIYVIAGSHFGAKTLLKKWRVSNDPVVLSAGKFLSDRRLAEYWPGFLSRLNAISPKSSKADNIVRGAQTAFNIFANAANLVEGVDHNASR